LLRSQPVSAGSWHARQAAGRLAMRQDDHAPLPDGVSASLREFLLLCFKKNPHQRAQAPPLASSSLRHMGWEQGARRGGDCGHRWKG
jgi:hypothetical protein